MSLFRHKCGDDNHRFEPRYSRVFPNVDMIDVKYIFDPVSEIEAMKDRIYQGDVCRYCGKVVNRKEDAK